MIATANARAVNGRRWWRVPIRCLAIAAAVVVAGCATNPPPAPVTTPSFPDFVFPNMPPAAAGRAVESDPRVRAGHERAWRFLQSGDLRAAEREFADLIKRKPTFYPAEVGLGYTQVAARRFKEALERFDRVVAGEPDYVPALAGRGDALLGLSREVEAVAAFESALRVDPGLSDIKRRVEVLRFGSVRNLVAAARRAADSGRHDEARRDYLQAIAATPDSAFLYRDLAVVEIRLNAMADAATHLRQATALDPTDVRSWFMLGDVCEKQGDYDGAVDAYTRASEGDSSEAVRAAIERVRERGDLAKLPAEFRAIPTLAQVSRGDLAALIGVRFQQVLASTRRRVSSVMTDSRGHWASPWIMTVTRVGVMDVYSNHTFQPRTIVRRVDLAHVVVRMLDVLGSGAPPPMKRPIADVGPDYLGYSAIVAAVASGIMPLVEGDSFRPSRPVGGPEAVEVMNRLGRLVPRGRGKSAP